MGRTYRFPSVMMLSVLGAGGACPQADLDIAPPPARVQAITAECEIDVEGTGLVDMEEDYLPHVVACENGAASYEALRAQAVAARSYAYYKLDAYPGQPIEDGQGDQVYSCSNPPSSVHYEAVRSTAGEVLRYNDTFVAAFYVSGAIPSNALCVAEPDDTDPHGTEHYVTYNYGRRGRGIEQTTLGWVSPNNDANRGCKSQNGANCLAGAGWDYEDILRFYFGGDIDLVVTEGECVLPDLEAYGCGSVVDGAAVVVDDADDCFYFACESDALPEERAVGVGGASLVVPGTGGELDCEGRWRFSIANAGEHRVEVHIADVEDRAPSLALEVRRADGVTYSATVSTATAGWRALGTYDLLAGRHQWVSLTDAASSGGVVAFDAVRVTSVDAIGGDLDAGVGDAGPAGQGDAGGDGDGDPDAGGDGDGDSGDGDVVGDGDGDEMVDAGTPGLVIFLGPCRCTRAAGTPAWAALALLGTTALAGRGRRRRA